MAGAKEAWIVNVHVKPGLMSTVAKYIKCQFEKISFISKDFLIKMALVKFDNSDSSGFPCIDSLIKEIYDSEPEDNIFKKASSIIQFNGYKISITNIQLIRRSC